MKAARTSQPSLRSNQRSRAGGQRSRARWLSLALGAAAALLGAGSCFTGSDGLLPPTGSLYFPTGVVVSPGRTTLYVVNSDFDLQYNGGTVQALNLGEAGGQPGVRDLARSVAQAIADGDDPSDVCALLGSSPNTNVSLYPGPCEAVDVQPFVRAFATVGAFGAGVTLLSRDDGQAGARLFVAVRGDPSITYFDVPDDRDPSQVVSPCDGDFCLQCAADGDEQRCGRSHRIGENIFTSQRGLLLPTEPTSVASALGRGSDPLVVAHQTAATASLVVNAWPEGNETTPFASTPSLEFLLEGLPDAPTIVTTIPQPRLVEAASLDYRPGFVVSHRAQNVLSILRYFDDRDAAPPRPFLVKSDDITITISGNNNDSRGMAFDTSRRDACEAEPACASDAACLESCLAEKVGFYVVSREPPSLIIGELQSEATREGDVVTGIKETLSLDESVPVPIGPSMVAVGQVVGPTGELETRVFVVCFDSRFVVVYDPVLRQVETMIRTGRGPFGLAFDTAVNEAGEAESFMYLTHFTDSYLSVIDLDTRRLSYATPIASFGPPVQPREEQ